MTRNVQSSARLNITQSLVLTTSTSAASSAFGSQTYMIRIAAPSSCTFVIGATPTATATDAFLPSTWVDYITVSPGQKIAFFSAGAQTVSIVECSS
jgi:hypothetical protein